MMYQNPDLTYSEAIEQVMLKNGYFAPLKLIYKEIGKYKDLTKIKGKTPLSTIQERVQRDKRFTRIGLGVYALTEYLSNLPRDIEPKTTSEKKERLHAEIQGMLIEIGNNNNEVENTYTNDKSWTFQNKTLGSLATLSNIPNFTYSNIINDTVKYFDVIWFNKRGFPYKIFEVEHTTNFKNAFSKFMELQDFNTTFYCISNMRQKVKFEKEISKVAFSSLKSQCEFLSYDNIINDYNIAITKTYL